MVSIELGVECGIEAVVLKSVRPIESVQRDNPTDRIPEDPTRGPRRKPGWCLHGGQGGSLVPPHSYTLTRLSLSLAGASSCTRKRLSPPEVPTRSLSLSK